MPNLFGYTLEDVQGNLAAQNTLPKMSVQPSEKSMILATLRT
jgi:hypothetical protein